MKYKVVPVEPTKEMLSEIHLIECFSFEALQTRYAAMISAAPDTGMVAVRRELLSKMWRTIEVTDSFNSFTAEEESEMIEALSAGV